MARLRGCAAALAVVGMSLSVLAGEASAETYKVSTTPLLEEAVSKANANAGANTIVLAGGVYLPVKTLTFTNTTGLQTVEGPAGSPTVVGETAKLDGGAVEPPFSELFVLNEKVSVTFKDVSIAHGGGHGLPAIDDFGTLSVESSTIAGNTGAGVHVEGGATATVRNSTVSDGADFGVVDHGTASFFNSTVAFNKNGGIENSGTLNLTNTIVAENKGSGDCVGGVATTSDHSLDSDGSCGVGALSSTNPLLQTTLQNDGGTTPVHSEKPTSPTINAGDEAKCTTTDQRGAPRPDVASTPCDIGADEYSPTAPTIKVPEEITTKATKVSGAVVTYTAEASGSNDVVRSFSCTPSSGSTFPVGTTEVKCTATDGHENTSTASFKVNVTANPPTVVTEPATAVTNSSATLNATVNPNGAPITECKLEYGTTVSYGQSAPCTPSPGSGETAVAVSAAVGFLNGGTTYHFRITATGGGIGTGSDQTFTTLSSPHWQKNGTKTKEGEKTATISWGTITLEDSATTVTCKTASAGNIENTASAAKTETVLLATYECKAVGGECVAKGGETRVGAPGLPSVEELKEEGENSEVFREESAGVQLNIECYKAGVLTEHALFKSGPVGAETGTFTPAYLNGATAGRPSEVSFDASSGHLFSETGGLKLTTKGKLKVEGYEGTPVPLISLGPKGSG